MVQFRVCIWERWKAESTNLEVPKQLMEPGVLLRPKEAPLVTERAIKNFLLGKMLFPCLSQDREAQHL